MNRRQQFQRNLRPEMKPLNVEGAYTLPAPPEDFDIDAASAEEMAKYGLPWIPPSQRGKEWKSVFNARKLAAGRVIPKLDVHKGETHRRRSAVQFADLNWAGGILQALTSFVTPMPNALCGYETAWNQQQHVIFLGSDNHIHELYFLDQWIHTDLTRVSGAPTPRGNTPLDAYVTPFNQQQHINFIGTDNHVHELYFKTEWLHNNLTDLAGAPPASLFSPLDGYETVINGQQHVTFIGADNHVYELYFNGNWGVNDLTYLAGASVLPKVNSPIDGYETILDKQQHVNFIGTDNHVYELYFDGNWHANDLMHLAKASVLPSTDSPLKGYETPDSQQHVNFIGTDSHVYELYFNGSWQTNDLSKLAVAMVFPRIGSPLDGYVSPDGQQHVNYIGPDNHVYELYFDSRWRPNDLTQLSGSPVAAINSPLIGYATSYNNQQHVNFVGTDNRLHEMFFQGHWQPNVLGADAQSVTAPWFMVQGLWQIPTVRKPSSGPSAKGWDSGSWVGIDGVGSIDGSGTTDVLQAGIRQVVSSNGEAGYSAWYEWFAPQQDNSPDYIYAVFISNFPVSPGDTIFCSVEYAHSGTAGQIFLANETTKKNFSIILAPPPGASFLGASVEWIMESPDDETAGLIPVFTPLVFNPAVGVGTQSFGNPQSAGIIEITSNNIPLTSVTLGNFMVAVQSLLT